MGQVKKEESKVISFSAFVEVDEDEKAIQINDHLLNMVLLISEKDESFKNQLINALEEL